ncbi:hypothetical protein K431DRAFT_278792 [Polychaeton citri CBS 116435]|uniref:DUF1275 domain protein n=1 Tax=Polychaeton citri CBS 116435 TaxID=1314669 RepID=A0A9P4UL30_9PEZI|nr:hypothetical protein K431DRAFT_278792 [Polychaeton citri CBS 116435]
MPQPSSSHEQEPLLPSSNGTSTTTKTSTHDNNARSVGLTIRNHLAADVNVKYADIVLIIMFFVSGLVDSGAYNAYECFVSMQTGNTVFAALGASNLPVASSNAAWIKSLTSILSFILGSFILSTFHQCFGQRKRWVLVFSFLLQLSLTAAAATLVMSGASSESPSKRHSMKTDSLPRDPGFPWLDLLPIGLLAFQASGKIVVSRALGYNGLPTLVLTTLMCDLMGDPQLFTAGLLSNATRNRRVSAFVLYFAGAVSGGMAASSKIGFAGGLWIATAIKFAVMLIWLCWRSEEKSLTDE